LTLNKNNFTLLLSNTHTYIYIYTPSAIRIYADIRGWFMEEEKHGGQNGPCVDSLDKFCFTLG